MPVWHAATKKWVEEGRLAVVGIIQEQHPERCRLFAQWQQFTWPILHDPVNVLNATGVPIVMAIDEWGVLRAIRPSLEDFEATFLNQTFPKPQTSAALPSLTPLRDAERAEEQARSGKRAEDWRGLGDTLAIWHTPARVNDAIAAYERALALEEQDLLSRFRLGVCYRMRYESPERVPGDFSRAVESWESALEGNPNQYIWRRRIQQYGPRLKKPYPFYDWVTRAEAAIRDRGETPIALPVRPTGAEIAAPSEEFESAAAGTPPDPLGRIARDNEQLIEATVAAVPTRAQPGETARIHLTFTPNQKRHAHWNNEAESLQVWLDKPSQGLITERLLEAPAPPQATSTETRRVDFEVKLPPEATGSIRITGYALYYVCEDVDGQCLYRRQDLELVVPVTRSQ